MMLLVVLDAVVSVFFMFFFLSELSSHVENVADVSASENKRTAIATDTIHLLCDRLRT